jgi:hypothetical protein
VLKLKLGFLSSWTVLSMSWVLNISASVRIGLGFIHLLLFVYFAYAS